MVSEAINRRKLVVVGDGNSGKTCMLIAFVDGDFRETYVPTIFESTVADVQLDDEQIQLALWDTAGQEEYDRLRTLSYPDSNVILVCFAIDNPDSLDNVYDKWLHEIRHYCRGVPFLLIGTKNDLRNDHQIIKKLKSFKSSPVSFQMGQLAASEVGAARYLECSAKTNDGIKQVFQEATKIAIRSGTKRRNHCIIL